MEGPSPANILLFDGFRLDRRSRVLSRRDDCGICAPLAVGSRALDILVLLAERPGELVSRAEIFSAVWPETVVEETNLNVQIAALRRALDERRADGSCIQTVPGRGYRLTVPVTQAEASAPPASGRPSGNGAAHPIAEPPAPPGSTTPSRSETAPPMALQQRKWPWLGTLTVAAGVLCLVAAVFAALNLHSSRFGGAGPAPRLSIVVLPFTDLSDRDPRQLADGVTENLTTDLSLHPDLRVISRNSAFTYRNKLVDTKQIGRELGVRCALEGSVQHSGNRLRVNTQLIDTDKDSQLWAARFDRGADDLFALQNEIASQIANTLGVELIAAEAARRTEHPDALGYILRGRAALLKPNSPEVYAEAIDLFEHALALDPQSVEAQTWLAGSLADRVLDLMSDSPTADIARAGRILAGSPRYAPAHFVRGQLLRAQQRWLEAIPEYEAALAINPNRTDALHALGDCKLRTGSIDEVIPLEEQAIRLNPRDPHIGLKYWRIGYVHLLQSRADDAILWLETSARDEPGLSFSRAALASAYALNGETGRAVAELAEARRLSGGKYYLSMAEMHAVGVTKTRTLVEAAYFAGLRKAGVPEE